MIKKRSILIVDDEVDFLSSIRRLLRKEPYTVMTADSGEAALEILKKTQISLVVSDYMMPGMDGLMLLKTIGTQYPNIITIMLTALSEIEIAMRAINESGIYRFFLKPVELRDLKITLKRALEYLEVLKERNDLRRELNLRDSLLRKLETMHPGITQIERDENGFYVIEE